MLKLSFSDTKYPPYFWVYILFMKAKFRTFLQAIKFDCLVLATFQSFCWFVSYIFDKLAPFFKQMFQKYFKSFFVHFSVLNISININHIVAFFFVQLVS